MLQSTRFPTAPEPVTTIAAILQLKDPQRFDLMAVPARILDKRRSGVGQVIVDVHLAEGSSLELLDAGSCASTARWATTVSKCAR